MDEPRNFNELVSWACWEIIKGITSGEKLEHSVHKILSYVRQWKPENKGNL